MFNRIEKTLTLRALALAGLAMGMVTSAAFAAAPVHMASKDTQQPGIHAYSPARTNSRYPDHGANFQPRLLCGPGSRSLDPPSAGPRRLVRVPLTPFDLDIHDRARRWIVALFCYAQRLATRNGSVWSSFAHPRA